MASLVGIASDASERESARGELTGSHVDAVDRFAAGQPLDQLGDPRLEPDAGPKAEQLLPAGGVRVAVADVACAVTGGSLRLDIDAETLGQQTRDVVDRARDSRPEVDRGADGPIRLQREHDPLDDIAHVDEVARLAAVLEDHRRAPVEKP